MTTTRPTLLLILAGLAGVVGWATVDLFQSLVGRSLPVPWTAAATLALLAVALFIWALTIRPRILRAKGTRPVSPFVAARTAALAMAASRTGALVAGFYAGIAVQLLSQLDNAVAQQRFINALAAVLAGFLLVLAALWLEHICRLPGDDEPDKQSATVDESAGDWVLPSNPRRTDKA